jgi:glycosyltransferase involved in cell wall biosynthesis
MHILLIHQAFVALDEPGGTRHHELARFLARRGHRITIIASQVSYLTGKPNRLEYGRKQDAEEPRITIIRTYTYSALHRSFVHRVLSFFTFMFSSFWAGLFTQDVDLIWGTSPPIFQGVTAWALARIKRKPFLFEVRDLWPAFAIEVGVLRSSLLIRLSLWLEGFLYRHADKIVVNSPGFIEHVQSRGARGVEVIPNGVDVCMFDPHANGHKFRQDHGLGSKFIAMYAGAHGMSNDLDLLLRAAKALEDCPKIAVVLVGDGKEKPALLALAQKLDLENVYFLPPIPKAGMAQALAASDACIAILKPIPMYATVFPNKVFDYMAAGRPVVLAIDGVIREVVEQAGCGIFAQPGDPMALAEAIRSLANDPMHSQAMGLRGRDYVVANFDREQLAGELADLIMRMG